jgi:hypothetical protein
VAARPAESADLSNPDRPHADGAPPADSAVRR